MDPKTQVSAWCHIVTDPSSPNCKDSNDKVKMSVKDNENPVNSTDATETGEAKRPERELKGTLRLCHSVNVDLWDPIPGERLGGYEPWREDLEDGFTRLQSTIKATIRFTIRMVSIYDQYARIISIEFALGWILEKYSLKKDSKGYSTDNQITIGNWEDMTDMENFLKMMNEIGADPLAPGRVDLSEPKEDKKVMKRWKGLRSMLSKLRTKHAE